MGWKIEAAQLFIFRHDDPAIFDRMRVLYLITGIQPTVIISFEWK